MHKIDSECTASQRTDQLLYPLVGIALVKKMLTAHKNCYAVDSHKGIMEFFRAFAYNCFMTLHINEHYGKNTHHIIEAIFKSMARAIKEAVTIDEAHIGQVVSSKGVL